MSWGYGVLATEVYDLDKPVGTSFGDVEYYEQFLRNGEGLILEPAVGTGRILVPLVQAGLAVDGYDSSPEMLSVCRERCAERGIDPTIREADMTKFVAPEEYSAVILPTGSITLLHGPDELRAALGCFRQSLKPGGRLVIDLPPPMLLNGSESMRSWRSEPYIWTLQTLHVAFDAAANQTTRWLRYDKWRDGALLATELQPFCLQHWSIAEFEAHLYASGFTDVSVTADYDADCAPAPQSDIWTFHATRL
jgi:SAM-dependent methyltransferase